MSNPQSDYDYKNLKNLKLNIEGWNWKQNSIEKGIKTVSNQKNKDQI